MFVRRQRRGVHRAGAADRFRDSGDRLLAERQLLVARARAPSFRATRVAEAAGQAAAAAWSAGAAHSADAPRHAPDAATLGDGRDHP